MRLNWQKIGLIALFVAAALAFAFFLYYFFFLPLFAPQPAPVVANINGQLVTAANINGRVVPVTNVNGQLVPVANVNANINTAPPAAPAAPSATAQGGVTKTQPCIREQASFSTMAPDGSLLYYNATDGKFYRAGADCAASVYNSQVFYDVSNVVWSNSRDQAVLQYPDGSNVIYDFSTNKQYVLPKHWTDFAFSPTDDQIAFKNMALDPENRYLAVTNLDGSNAKAIEDIGGVENQFQVNWSPNNQMVADFVEHKDANRSEVYFIGLNNENFKSLVVEGSGFQGIWAPQGDRIVYSVYDANNNYQPQLWISDAQGENIGANRQNIGLNTWADKCSFGSENTLYCAVPETLPYGSGLEPDSALTSADDLYVINIDTGARRLLAIPQGYHSIDKIFPSKDGSELYFSDANTQRVYKIDLK